MSEGCSVSQSISLWHCQNVLSTLVLTKVFGIHCIFYIVLPIRLEICRSAFFFVPRQKVCAPDLHRARNLSRLRGSRKLNPMFSISRNTLCESGDDWVKRPSLNLASNTNDTHIEKLNSVPKFIRMKFLLLLTFLIYLYNRVS